MRRRRVWTSRTSAPWGCTVHGVPWGTRLGRAGAVCTELLLHANEGYRIGVCKWEQCRSKVSRPQFRSLWHHTCQFASTGDNFVRDLVSREAQGLLKEGPGKNLIEVQRERQDVEGFLATALVQHQPLRELLLHSKPPEKQCTHLIRLC